MEESDFLLFTMIIYEEELNKEEKCCFYLLKTIITPAEGCQMV
jgi:hypothetical protein